MKKQKHKKEPIYQSEDIRGESSYFFEEKETAFSYLDELLKTTTTASCIPFQTVIPKEKNIKNNENSLVFEKKIEPIVKMPRLETITEQTTTSKPVEHVVPIILPSENVEPVKPVEPITQSEPVEPITQSEPVKQVEEVKPMPVVEEVKPIPPVVEEKEPSKEYTHRVKNMDYDLIQLNLLQLGRIQNGDRLWIDEDKVIINIENRVLSSVRRYFGNNGREMELNFIKILVDNAIRYCQNIVSSSKQASDLRLLQSLLANLQCAKNGLCKLKITYINDNLFQSQIDAITSKIDNNTTDCNQSYN